MQDMECW